MLDGRKCTLELVDVDGRATEGKLTDELISSEFSFLMSSFEGRGVEG